MKTVHYPIGALAWHMDVVRSEPIRCQLREIPGSLHFVSLSRVLQSTKLAQLAPEKLVLDGHVYPCVTYQVLSRKFTWEKSLPWWRGCHLLPTFHASWCMFNIDAIQNLFATLCVGEEECCMFFCFFSKQLQIIATFSNSSMPKNPPPPADTNSNDCPQCPGWRPTTVRARASVTRFCWTWREAGRWKFRN